MPCQDCKHCEKQGLLILPLRYSAVVADDPAALATVPKLAGKLGKGVTDLKLDHAAYGVRLLRPGYLYVLTEREGIKSWEGHMVLETGQLYGFSVDVPPVVIPPPLCDRDQTSMHAYMVGINNAHQVPNAWFLFSPNALTLAKLKEYKTNADAYASKGKMQHFSPKAWLAKTTDQPHTLLADELHQNVIEYVLYHQQKDALSSPLGKAMGTQLFPAHNIAYAGTPANDKGEYQGTLGNIHTTLRRNGGTVLVVNDHIGITQELNDFRNAPLEGLQHYLAAEDQFGASNQHRLQIFEAIQEVKTGFEKGIIDNTQAFLDQSRERGDRWFARRLSRAKSLRNMGRTADAEAIEQDVERSIKVRDQNLIKLLEKAKAEGREKWRDKYESRLDPDEMERFKKKLDTHTANAFAKADQRASDHLKWFESDRLVDAFDMYDDKDQPSGFNFAIESAICSFGLSGCKVGEDKIDAWISAASIDRKNLYMRGFYHNQQDLVAAAKQAYKDVQAAATPVEAASDISAATMLKATKLLVDGFKKTDAAFDEWVRNQKQDFSRKWTKPSILGRAAGQQLGLELILFHKVSDLTRGIFRKGLGGSFDKKLTAWLSGALYARLGGTAGKLRYDELMLKIDKSKLAEGYKGRSAERNAELAQRKARGKATSQTNKQIAPSLADLVADAQEKNKTHLKLEQLVGNDSPPTNNYHQTRIGVVLACIEVIGLGEKVSHAKLDAKSALEIGGSVMAVGSIVMDIQYSAAKSIREIQPYKSINAVSKGADVVRGGLKLGAGALGMGAGFCGSTLDFMKMQDEKDVTLKWIYGLRAATGSLSAVFTMVAAFSYSESLCRTVAANYAKTSTRYRLLAKAGDAAFALSSRVRLLVWVARFNWIGLALTVVEIGYLFFKDDDLQNWCEKSVFRKKKSTVNRTGRSVSTHKFPDASKELETLEQASQAVGVGG